MNEFTCNICGAVYPVSERNELGNRLLCHDCYAENTVECSCCGIRIPRECNVGNDATPLCYRCHDNHYTYCESCGSILHLDDAFYLSDYHDEPYCERCYDQLTEKPIHDYYYKPLPIFYGESERYFGVELEIDGAGEYDDNAERLLDIANYSREHIYIKHDGSLDDGMEIVTHPMTLEYHVNHMPWEELLSKAKRMDYTSHQAGTCGLHVHINRTAFGDTEANQDTVIARILYFFEKHWEELLKFSRRTQSQLDRWAARYGYKDQPQDILKHAKSSYCNRYTAVNLTNVHTVEFRMFRGTLKLNTVLATLQLLDKICDVALFMSDEKLKELSWTSFVNMCTAPELVQYLKERQLYVNEPVESEGEI